VYEKGDSCSLTDVIFSRVSEIVTSNMRGQLKLFDLRSNQQEAAACFLLSNDQSAIHTLARHPTQVGNHCDIINRVPYTSPGLLSVAVVERC
jgi:hypothetical protein